MNNLMYLRDACYGLMDVDIHHGLLELSSSWLHRRSSNSDSLKDSVTTLHQLRITDPFLNSIFRGDIVYYSTAFIGQARFTTTQFARDKVTDDSSIIFKTSSNESFGRIRRIFRVNDAKPFFYVDMILETADFECTTSLMSVLVLPFKLVYLKRDEAVSSSTEVTLSRSVFSIDTTTTHALSIDFLIYKSVRDVS